MGNHHKIDKYGLQEEYAQLRDMGYSYSKIAQCIKDNHPEISDLKNLSSMSIMRYNNNKEETEIKESIKQGKNPLAEANAHFIHAVSENIKELNETKDWVMDIKKRAIESENLDMEIKALKGYINTLDSHLKQLIALKQWGETQTNKADRVSQNQLVLVKNLMVGVTTNLCPTCRANVNKELEKYFTIGDE